MREGAPLLIAVMFAAVLGAATTATPAPTSAAPAIDTSKTEIRLPAARVAGVVPQGTNDEIVCRKEQLLGSRMFKTVCEQKSVAEERRLLDRQALREIQRMSMVGAP
jgi:hypothetical protein